ncbi:hypothetical protein OK016_08785 [Vibrio chagasii]|nr:hypothetical protein [Vibrio chagasii]
MASLCCLIATPTDPVMQALEEVAAAAVMLPENDGSNKGMVWRLP